jgi:hypothetical protein
MDKAERSRLIARYREGPDVLATALAEVGEDALDATPPDGGWTPRQVVHHVADSEMTSAIRLRRLLAEEQPVIQGYDEEEFARRLFYDTRPVEPSLAAVRAARASTASILDQLADSDWIRAGTHSELGPYSMEGWLRIYAEHCHDHAEQIRRARPRTRL